MVKAVAEVQAGNLSSSEAARKYGLTRSAVASAIARRKPGHAAAHKTACKAYEKTKPGYLMRAYRNMLSRVSGIQRKKAHLYAGKDILPKDDFYAWAEADPAFNRLYQEWVASGYARGLSPSVNRINPGLGYVPGNIEWITHSLNSALGAMSKRVAKSASAQAVRKLVGL